MLACPSGLLLAGNNRSVRAQRFGTARKLPLCPRTHLPCWGGTQSNLSVCAVLGS